MNVIWQDHVTSDRKIIVCLPCLTQQRVCGRICQDLSPVFSADGYQEGGRRGLKCGGLRRMIPIWKDDNFPLRCNKNSSRGTSALPFAAKNTVVDRESRRP